MVINELFEKNIRFEFGLEHFMVEIKEIVGNSAQTFFKMTDGKIIVAGSEFRAKSGKIDGFIVYKDGIKYFDTNTNLTPQEITELIEQYEKYKSTHIDVVDWA